MKEISIKSNGGQAMEEVTGRGGAKCGLLSAVSLKTCMMGIAASDQLVLVNQVARKFDRVSRQSQGE